LEQHNSSRCCVDAIVVDAIVAAIELAVTVKAVTGGGGEEEEEEGNVLVVGGSALFTVA